MKVEKKSSNKIGLVILLIVVLAGLGCGGYFLYKHKDKLNIDWNFTLPWQKEKEEKQAGSDNDLKQKTQKKQTDVTFKAPEIVLKSSFDIGKFCKAKVLDFKDSDTEFAVTLEISNIAAYTSYCEIEFYQFAADGYTIPGDAKVRVENGETKSVDITMNKSDLESQELASINTLFVSTRYTTAPDADPSLKTLEIKFTNTKPVNNDKNGINIDVLNNTTLKYYKTTTDATNTYLYFIFHNQSGSYTADIKVKKLLINDKIYDVKDFDEKLSPDSRRIVYIAVPKKIFSKVKKFTISFINISTNNRPDAKEDFKTSFYISNEYSREV